MTERIILPICPQTWFKASPGQGKLLNIPEVCMQKTYEIYCRGGAINKIKDALTKYWGNSLEKIKGGYKFNAFKELDESYFEGIRCRVVKTRTCCIDYEETKVCRHVISGDAVRIKHRIEQYNKYKVDVLFLAKKAGFELPQCGFSVYFHVPIPDYWTKAKKEAFHGQPKLSVPDIDNYEKAFYDSLKVRDEQVGQVSGHGKFWFDPAKIQDENLKDGWIEILLNQPVYNPYGVTFIDQKAFDKKPKRKWVRRNKRKEKNLFI